MHLIHVAQCTIQNRNVPIAILNGALWHMEQVYYGICQLLEVAIHIHLCTECIQNFSIQHNVGVSAVQHFSGGSKTEISYAIYFSL